MDLAKYFLTFIVEHSNFLLFKIEADPQQEKWKGQFSLLPYFILSVFLKASLVITIWKRRSYNQSHCIDTDLLGMLFERVVIFLFCN